MIKEYWKSRLNSRTQSAYDIMLSEFRRYSEHIRLRNFSNNEAKQAYAALHSDHPELFYISPVASFSSSGYLGSLQLIVEQKNLYGIKEIKERKQKIEELKKDVLSAAKGMNNIVDKEKLVCDMILDKTIYEIDNIYNQNASEVLIHGRGQCSGISKAGKIMLEWLNVPVILINGHGFNAQGNGGQHTWCIVEDAGKFYHLDITYMLGANSLKQKPYRYLYFNYSDSETSVNHEWDRHSVPQCVAGNKPENGKTGINQKANCEGRVINSMYELRQELKKAVFSNNHMEFVSMIPADSVSSLMKAIKICCEDVLNQTKMNCNISISIQDNIVKLDW